MTKPAARSSRSTVAWLERAAAIGLWAAVLVEAGVRDWHGSPLALLLLSAASVLPLAASRRYPEASVLVSLAAASTLFALPGATDCIALVLSMVAALFAAGARVRNHRVAVTAAAAVLAVLLSIAEPADHEAADYLFVLGLMAGAYVLGVLLASRAELAGAEAERAERATDQAQLVTRLAVSDERARIARELHDVVAHAVGVIVVQSVAGRTVLPHDPAAAREAFGTISTTGQHALHELRRLLGVLRTVDEAVLLAPQPTLADLEELLEQARDAGVSPRLTVTGPRSALPAGVELTAYRILQESLSNAARHAGPVPVDVTLDYEPALVRVGVVNAPGSQASAPPADATTPDGTAGLVGLRERAALCGGWIEAGPTDDGGFAVRSELPLSTEAAVPA